MSDDAGAMDVATGSMSNPTAPEDGCAGEATPSPGSLPAAIACASVAFDEASIIEEAKAEVHATLKERLTSTKRMSKQRFASMKGEWRDSLLTARAAATVDAFLASDTVQAALQAAASAIASRVASACTDMLRTLAPLTYKYSASAAVVHTLRTEVRFAGLYSPAKPLPAVLQAVVERAWSKQLRFQAGVCLVEAAGALGPVLQTGVFSSHHVEVRHRAYPYVVARRGERCGPSWLTCCFVCWVGQVRTHPIG